MSKIARAPARPPATSPSDPRYFDERDLEAELKRTFQICHECRMCVNYCGSFPELFSRIDRDVDAGRAEGAEALTHEDFRVVSEACWQCKLCFIKCPYTADEGSYELLDFPRLMTREKAVHVRRNGVSTIDRLLGEPQLVGAYASGWRAGASNLIQASRLLRKVQEKVTGVSAEFPLPPFASEPFDKWMRKHKRSARAGDAGEVVLFATCYGLYNTPSVPRAAVLVLEHIGYRVLTVEETCCGMPNLDGGDIAGARAKIAQNARQLLPHVRAGRNVLVSSPTCGYTMKREWCEYLDTPEVREVSAAVFDIMEFLEVLRREKKLPKGEGEGLGNVAYHVPCHLRAQKIGFPAARVLEKALPDTTVSLVQECSAVDGTWGMKAAHYEEGRRYAQKMVRAIEASRADVVVSDCSLSMLRIVKETDATPIHPIEALARAWGLVGKPKRVTRKQKADATEDA
jgi:glycerol-3-phosphate dehydrogenase subunit C